jgi:hypothetical protein
VEVEAHFTVAALERFLSTHLHQQRNQGVFFPNAPDILRLATSARQAMPAPLGRGGRRLRHAILSAKGASDEAEHRAKDHVR